MKGFAFFTKHKWITLFIIAAIAAGAFLAYNQIAGQAATATEYQTTKAERGTLTATIGATGTVRAEQSVVLTWQTSGIVEAVNVSIGDKVTADQTLANLKQTSLPQNIITAQADLVSAKKSLDDLLNSNTTTAEAQKALADAKKAVEDAQIDVDTLNFDRASDLLLEKTQSQIDLAKKQVAMMSDIYKHYSKRPDGDPDKAQALLNMTNAQINLNNLIAQYNWYTGHVSETEAEQYRAVLALTQSQLSDAVRALEYVKDGSNPDDIASARAYVAAALATLNQAKIIAPFDGTVTNTNPIVGDKVSSGDVAFRVDNLSRLLVDLAISEVDINSVQLDQPVTVTFDSVQGKTYSGKVVKISGAGDVTSSGVNFTVTVALTEFDDLVRPGMTAAVTITVREVKDALLIPNRAVRQADNKRVVYVLKDGLAVPVEVRIGAMSDTVSEVVGGDLKEGDLIITNPPANSSFGPGDGGGMRGPFGGG
jgi:HlyD family secretion protein